MNKAGLKYYWQSMTLVNWQKVNRVWLLSVLMLVLCACSLPLRMPANQPIIPDLPPLPRPTPIHTSEVMLAVRDAENVPKGTIYFKKAKDYENMALNLNDMLRYIRQANVYMDQCK